MSLTCQQTVIVLFFMENVNIRDPLSNIVINLENTLNLKSLFIQFTFLLGIPYLYFRMSLKIKDAIYGNKLNLIYSHECISEGIHIPEPKVYEDHPNEWFEEIKESDKAVLDSGELGTP